MELGVLMMQKHKKIMRAIWNKEAVDVMMEDAIDNDVEAEDNNEHGPWLCFPPAGITHHPKVGHPCYSIFAYKCSSAVYPVILPSRCSGRDEV